MPKFLLASLILTVFSSLPHYAYATKAMDAFKKKDYNEAYRLWTREPDKAESQYGLGRILLEGLGGPADRSKGLDLLAKAANKNYMRAIRYLAKYYERKGSFKLAITYLKKTGNPKKDLNLQSKILKLTKKRISSKTPLWKTKMYCREATVFSQAGGEIPEKNLMEKCAISNNKSIYTKRQALDSLAKTFASEPTEEIFTMLKANPLSIMSESVLLESFAKNPNELTLNLIGKSMLNPKSKSFRPDLVGLFFWQNQENNQEKNLLRNLAVYNINFETCKSLPMKTELEKNRRSSYCLLSALIEQKSNVIIRFAYAYIKGTDGLSRNPLRGEYLLTVSGKDASTAPLQTVKLDRYRLSNKWKEHLTSLEKMRKKLKLTQKQIELHIGFQLEKLTDYKSSGYNKGHGVQLANVLLDVPSVPRKMRIKGLQKLPDLPDVDTLIYESAEVQLNLLLNKLDKKIYSSSSLDISVKDAPTLRSGSSNSAEFKKSTRESKKNASARSARTGKSGLNYKKNKINCDAGVFESCAPAAKRIMGDAPPAEFANMKKKDREKEGIKLLKKGADAEDDNAMIMLYDIFKKSRDPDEKALAKSYLAILVEKENPAGILRENMKLIPGNPITGLVTAVGKMLGDKKVRRACKEIQRVAESETLSFKDQTMALEVLDRNACKRRKGT
jgi:hypothetical protein